MPCLRQVLLPMALAGAMGLVVLLFLRRRLLMRRHLAAVAALDQYPGAAGRERE